MSSPYVSPTSQAEPHPAVATPLTHLKMLPAASQGLVVPGAGSSAGDAEHTPGLTAIGPVGSERKARDWALVLQSSDIWHYARPTFAGWVLLVRDEDYELAAASIDRYEAENRDWPPRPVRERPRHPPSVVAPLLFAALAVFFVVTGPVAGHSFWFQRGTAVSDLVVGGQPWRALTALTLHADSGHVLGNVVSGSIFASAVQRRLGAGATALALVASGAMGNLANALWHHGMGQAHASIGASTAVFGAIGVLAATQVVLDRSQRPSGPRDRVQVIAPIVGGLALLGALGASPQADLGAHLFGFLAGVLLGVAAGLAIRGRAAPSAPTRRGVWLQLALGAVAIAAILVPWQLALHR